MYSLGFINCWPEDIPVTASVLYFVLHHSAKLVFMALMFINPQESSSITSNLALRLLFFCFYRVIVNGLRLFYDYKSIISQGNYIYR